MEISQTSNQHLLDTYILFIMKLRIYRLLSILVSVSDFTPAFVSLDLLRIQRTKIVNFTKNASLYHMAYQHSPFFIQID